MNTFRAESRSPAFPDTTSVAVAFSRDDFFECPRCHRQCKSRTWFLKHLETCTKSASSSSTHGNTVSGEGSGVSPRAEAFATKANNSHRHPSRSSATQNATPPLLNSATSTTSSSNTSHSHVYGHKTSRLTQATGSDGQEPAPCNLIEVGRSANTGLWRSPAVYFGGCRDGRGESNNTTPAEISWATPRSHTDDIPIATSASDAGANGSILVNGVLKPTSPSQGSSLYVGSPRRPRAGESFGESCSAPTSTAFGRTSAPAVAPASSSLYTTQRDEVEQHRPPARQDSFRLQSDFTWTQYTPSASEGEGDDEALEEHDGSFLDHPSRQLLRSRGRPQRRGHPAARESGSSFCNTSADRRVSPGAAEKTLDTWTHEQKFSRKSSHHRSSSPGTAEDVGRHTGTGVLQGASLPREGDPQMPRRFSASIGEFSPPERNVIGATEGCQSVGSGANSDRLHRSARDSASPVSPGCLSSASPMLVQAIRSPTVLHINVPSTSTTAAGSSMNRFNGVNPSSSGGGGRTPRHGDRSGVITPRAISFQRGRAVGSGGFGTVYQAILSDGSLAAVKELKLENANLKAIDREVRAMSSIPPHPNCVRYLGSRYSAHHYYIIMEYISGGSINSLRKSVGRFRESVFQRYAYMVLLGLSHLHTNGILHRDIKGANVLLDESGCAKIVDFGCSGNLNQATTTLGGGGTPLWMAPEVCRGEPATEKSDVWAFGCLCLEMTNDTGVPWDFPPGMTLQGLVYALACAKLPPAIPTDLSPEAQDFLRRCLQIDPGERATIAELLQHPFFDVDLMDDSEEDELLSSYGASARHSAVKRAVRQVNRSSAPDVAGNQQGQQYSDEGDEAIGAAKDLQGSPLVQGFAGVSLSSRGMHSSAHGPISDSDAGTLLRSPNSHSKSASGPQLDHYTRSVNIGFRLQAVDEDDSDDGGGAGEAEGKMSPSHKFLGGSPPATPLMAVSTNHCHTTSSKSVGVEEDENEYTQMITEIITQAREAYTDEERRMTERRRRLNMMYRSSDEDTSLTATLSSGSDISNNGSSDGSESGSSAEEGERSEHASIENDLSTFSSSDGDVGANSRSVGGPRRHSLGATWRNQSAHAPAASENTDELQNSDKDAPQHKPKCASRTKNPTASSASASSACRSRLPWPDACSSATLAATSPASTRVASGDTSFSVYTTSPLSGTRGVEAGPQLQRSPHGVPLSSPSFSYPPHQQQQQQQQQGPFSVLPVTRHREVMSDLPRDARRPQGVPRSPCESGGRAGMAATITQPLLSSSPLHTSASAEIPPPLPSSSATQRSTIFGAVLSEPGSSSRTPPLTVGGPHRQTPPQPLTTKAVPLSRHTDVVASPIEWYTGGSGRLDVSSASRRTDASGHLTKELSMAQKEMQDMLEWGTKSDRRHAVSSSSPHIGRRSSKALSATTKSRARGGEGHRSRHRFRHSCRNHGDVADSECTTETETFLPHESTGLSATETVAASQQQGKRRLWGLGIFRNMKSK
ncbi:protein kinase, putative [Leishmania tarentolae]|uniref:Protein kinase, putative n=1 Tax=Leishmania tarentolae TaxID=5689 RepID=A0A640KJB6_LEITA|nr:protein kinase, putative [Leishmania tarentolae]